MPKDPASSSVLTVSSPPPSTSFRGAYLVTVVLSDGQVTRATIVFESPVIDFALIKIEAPHLLSPATLAREDVLKLGQRVVAVGNPEALGISASAGIVSALDRNLKTSPYDRYIQTDAAINPGNSGGPLFNLDGQVVGMNSLRNRGSDGLGFAIPVDSIAFAVDQLKKDGSVRCGTLGLKGQKLTAKMQNAIGFPGSSGVIVAVIDPGSAAARAGLQVGDVIETLDGRKLLEITVLNHVACLTHQPISLGVWRNGLSMYLQVTADVEEIKSATDRAAKALPRFAGARDLGITLRLVDDPMRRRYGLKPGCSGFVVIDVAEASEAEAAGVQRGDLIERLHNTPLTAKTTFDDVFAREGESGRHYLNALIQSKGNDSWVTLPMRF